MLQWTCLRIYEFPAAGSHDEMVSIYEEPIAGLVLPDGANSIPGETFDCLTSPGRFERGDVVAVCHDESTIMGYAWLSFQDLWVGEARLFLSVRDDEAVAYDPFVFPKYRGRRVHPRIASVASVGAGRRGDGPQDIQPAILRISFMALAEAVRRGRKRVIESSNTNPLKIHKRIGGTQVMSLYSAHLFGRFSLHWATGRPLASGFYR